MGPANEIAQMEERSQAHSLNRTAACEADVRLEVDRLERGLLGLEPTRKVVVPWFATGQSPAEAAASWDGFLTQRDDTQIIHVAGDL